MLDAASIDSFDGSFTQMSPTEVYISGEVSDEDPSTVEITFTGAFTGSTFADEFGYFEFYGDADSLGTITAIATDDENLDSIAADLELAVEAPTIDSLEVEETGFGKNVSISGAITHDLLEGVEITISGVVSGTLTSDSSGNFSGELEATSLGTITAMAVDQWDQSSDSFDVELTSDVPTIDSLAIETTGSGQQVHVYGSVTDETQDGVDVFLTGIITADFMTDSSGSFDETFEVSSSGPTTAVAIDAWGQTSVGGSATLATEAPEFVDESGQSTSTYTFTVSAGTTGGDEIGPTYVVDSDTTSADLTYRLTDASDAGRFAIDSGGVITATTDLLANQTYTITVEVQDEFQNVDDVIVDVGVGQSPVIVDVLLDAETVNVDSKVGASLYVSTDLESLDGYTVTLSLTSLSGGAVEIRDEGGQLLLGPSAGEVEFQIGPGALDQYLPSRIFIKGVTVGDIQIDMKVQEPSGRTLDDQLVAMAVFKKQQGDQVTVRLVDPGVPKVRLEYRDGDGADSWHEIGANAPWEELAVEQLEGILEDTLHELLNHLIGTNVTAILGAIKAECTGINIANKITIFEYRMVMSFEDVEYQKRVGTGEWEDKTGDFEVITGNVMPGDGGNIQITDGNQIQIFNDLDALVDRLRRPKSIGTMAQRLGGAVARFEEADKLDPPAE